MTLWLCRAVPRWGGGVGGAGGIHSIDDKAKAHEEVIGRQPNALPEITSSCTELSMDGME